MFYYGQHLTGDVDGVHRPADPDGILFGQLLQPGNVGATDSGSAFRYNPIDVFANEPNVVERRFHFHDNRFVLCNQRIKFLFPVGICCVGGWGMTE